MPERTQYHLLGLAPGTDGIAVWVAVLTPREYRETSDEDIAEIRQRLEEALNELKGELGL
jgi:hypothetical protein